MPSSERPKKYLVRASYPLEIPPDSSRGPSLAPSTTRTRVAAAAIQPTSYFAPAQRAPQQEIELTVEMVAQSPVTTALLRSATSMMCILNEHRQIVAINSAMLDRLDMAHSDDAIGQRPGEAMRCIHNGDHSGGCGTGPFCRACDATVAIVASQSTNRPVEREAFVSFTTRKGEHRDLALLARATPFELDGERFTIFCMTDIGPQKLIQELEHSFLHDISNLAMGLSAASSLLHQEFPETSVRLADDIGELTRRLSREVTVQRLLISSDPSRYRVDWQKTEIAELIRFSRQLADTHPSAQFKRLVVDSRPGIDALTTDCALVEHVLANMLLNAFESTTVGGEVQLVLESFDHHLRFVVHNAGSIPPVVAARIFHRHFTTRTSPGRGQGTYAIRLLGEVLLQGKVGFSTDAQLGTEFFLELPLRPDQNRRSMLPKR